MTTTWREGDVLMPGDILKDLAKSETSGKTVLGPGLRQVLDTVSATKPGVLKFKSPNIYWVDSHQKRVMPNFTWVPTGP